jgi:arginine:pyruvate transaminase
VKHAEALSMCMLFGLPGFIQEAAITALAQSATAESRIREFCSTRREQLLAGLDRTPGIRCSIPDAGMFTLIDVRGTGLTGNEFMHGLYRAERVSVIDGGAFGTETRGFVRLCFATDEATLSEGVGRIRRYAATLTR